MAAMYNLERKPEAAASKAAAVPACMLMGNMLTHQQLQRREQMKQQAGMCKNLLVRRVATCRELAVSSSRLAFALA